VADSIQHLELSSKDSYKFNWSTLLFCCVFCIIL